MELKITKKIILTDRNQNKEYEIFSLQSFYEIPILEVNTLYYVYEVFNDVTLSLNEEYQVAQKRIPLPNLTFPFNSIETFQKEIGGVFYLLNSRN